MKQRKRNGSNDETIGKTFKIFGYIYRHMIGEYAPKAEAWYVTEGYDDVKQKPIRVNLNKHYKRDNKLSLKHLESYGLIDIEKINGIACVKWIGPEPTFEMVKDFCNKFNVLKNRPEELETNKKTKKKKVDAVSTEKTPPVAPHLIELKVEEMSDRDVQLMLLEKLTLVIENQAKLTSLLNELKNLKDQ